MKEVNLKFPESIFMNSRGIKLDIENPFENVISIDKMDYIPYYLDNLKPGNKGSNIILKLVKAQDWDDDHGYPIVPDLILKICRNHKVPFEDIRSQRFLTEIEALITCNEINSINTIGIFHYGLTSIKWDRGSYRDYRFYTMEYADQDLSTYLSNTDLTLLDRVGLCLEICESLKLIWDAKYYHRDIKPDNVLFSNGVWKIADLGLAEHRDREPSKDEQGEWIGPRGWQSPESINKFLTEKTPWSKRFDFEIDHQSDLYQLGKLIWYIIQGNCPEGGIRRKDFILRDDKLYQVIRTLLNNGKRSRTKRVEELIVSLKRIYSQYLIGSFQFSLHWSG